MSHAIGDALRLPGGPVDLTTIETDAAPGFDGKKADGKAALADKAEIERRYGAINDFEARLAREGVSIIKCMLHISAEEQKERLAERLANPEKHWKYNPGDLDERALWPAYREAYEIALERTSTDVAPWYVVPSDKKWYRNLAVAQVLLDTLRGLDLQWPAADFDVVAETERLASEAPVQ